MRDQSAAIIGKAEFLKSTRVSADKGAAIESPPG